MAKQNRHSADEEWRIHTEIFQDKHRECGEIGSLWKNKQGAVDAYFKVGERMMSLAGGCQSEKGMPAREELLSKSLNVILRTGKFHCFQVFTTWNSNFRIGTIVTE